MQQLLHESWILLSTTLYVVISSLLTVHAVLNKRETTAAIGWIGLLWLSPFLGAALYVMFGINRIHRKAERMGIATEHSFGSLENAAEAAELARQAVGDRGIHLARLANLVGTVVSRPLLYGNSVTMYRRGDEAYPAMIEAIDQAEHTVSLCSYIFDRDRAGYLFLEAFKRAMDRGVEVRVLIDGVGASYSFPTMVRQLRKAGVPVAKFNASLFPTRFIYRNLRNHRKILVVDGRLGFTGGMNIRAAHMLDSKTRHPVLDTHFRVEGPVVSHLQEAFASDWHFSTGETLAGRKWFPRVATKGTVLARGLADGPDENVDNIRTTILGALACATRSVMIATPYFLPDESMIAALNVAALRGIEVDIILPSNNNIALVHWASIPTQRRLIEKGCRVWLSQPHFDHAKLMLVDECWTLIGSANLDPRSLRLNFEFNVECYDTHLGGEVAAFLREKIERSRRISLSEIDDRHIAIKLRDGVARLASPYL